MKPGGSPAGGPPGPERRKFELYLIHRKLQEKYPVLETWI